MRLENKEKATLAASSLLFLAAAVSIKLGGFSTASLVNLQNSVFRNMFLPAGGTLEAVGIVLSPFLSVILGLIFVTAALAVLASHGYRSGESRTGAVAGIIGGAIFIAAFGVSITATAFAAGIFLSSFYILPLANTYGQELKRWVRYRTGSNSVGKVLFIFNIVLAAGIFAAVLADMPHYQDSFRNDFKESILQAIGNVPGADVEKQVDAALSQSPLFASYFRWLPVLTAFGAWIILEFFRSVVLSNIAGAITHFAIKEKR